MTKFTETIDLLKSASAWDKFSLGRFGVEFQRTEHTPLANLITDPRYYNPETETRRDFARRCSMKASLTAGYDRILKASQDVTEDDLMTARVDDSVDMKLDENQLQYVMLSLVDLLETDSKEAQELERVKGKQTANVTYTSTFDRDSPALSSSSHPENNPYTHPRFPISFETPDNKRKISDTSFGTRSTESTPNKLCHPEAKVQSLQNAFVNTIITKLWSGRIDIPWAQGRHMFLTYSEFHICHILAHNRTVSTSFQYTFRPSADKIVVGRVRAIADGTLRVKTNKRHDPTKYCMWSKQRCTLSFEVLFPVHLSYL